MAERRKRVVQPWVWSLGGAVGALLIVFVLVVGPWLFTRYPHRGLTAEQELKAKNDVRTTLVQALAGLAVAGGLAVTYSTYRQNQRDQAERRAEQDRLYQLSQAEQADRRAEQDRAYQLNLAAHVNELYTKAVEQLGHDQAPVRLGALYSLTHLAQANPQQRLTVVDVLCAYLRMPYTQPPQDEETEPKWAPARQEMEVRLTAQRLLVDHVRVPVGLSGEDAQRLPPSPDQPFWPGISLNLTGAALFDFDLKVVSVVSARFERAVFAGDAGFDNATFTGDASFLQATFTGDASFLEATFVRDATFDKVAFTRNAWFHKTTFTGEAAFEKATFTDTAWFEMATFGDAFFDTTFIGSAHFNKVTFTGDAWFDKTTFTDCAWFNEATFANRAVFDEVRVLNLDNSDLNGDRHGVRRSWPDGWTVRADADDPTRGTLVREEQTKSPAAAPPPDSTSR